MKQEGLKPVANPAQFPPIKKRKGHPRKISSSKLDDSSQSPGKSRNDKVGPIEKGADSDSENFTKERPLAYTKKRSQKHQQDKTDFEQYNVFEDVYDQASRGGGPISLAKQKEMLKIKIREKNDRDR